MKFQSSTVAAAALLAGCSCWHPSTEAWTPPLPSSSTFQNRNAASLLLGHNNKPRSFSTLLGASVVAEDEMVVPEAPTTPGTVVAEGSVISFFQGGLTAIRIEEEALGSVTASSSPEVLSPTDVPSVSEQKAESSSASSAHATNGADFAGREVVFPDGSKGVVVAHRPPIIFVYNGMEKGQQQDGTVKVLGEMAPVFVSDDVRVVGWDGQPLAGQQQKASTTKEEGTPRQRAMFAPIPQLKDIALINSPMLTGISFFDVLAPIGQGQNMLMIGHDLNEIRDYVCDFISTQVKGGVVNESQKMTKFVYAAIDDSQAVVEKLHSAGVADNVHVVLSSSSEKEGVAEDAANAAQATAMAATACSIAESYALDQGMNAVVIIDTLDQHKKLWDATTRVLVDEFGIESVVKADREGAASSEMRAFYSSIIQRAGRYKESKGGGSVTLLLLTAIPEMESSGEDIIYPESDFEGSCDKVRARIQMLLEKKIPLTAANLRKIDIPIPSTSEGQRRLVLQHMDDLISMSDGQIWFDEKLQEAGQSPPMDPQRSVTRVGIGADTESRADAPAVRRIAEGLRLALSQAAHMDGVENSAASQKQTRRTKALLLAMHQEAGKGGRKLSETCTALLAASRGLLDAAVESGKLAGTESGQQLINDMLNHAKTVAPSAMAQVDETLDLSQEVQQEILDAIESFFSS